jgi:hypothetical protein
MGARALQMKPFSLSDYKTEKSVQRKEIIQMVLPPIPEGNAEEDVEELEPYLGDELKKGTDTDSGNPIIDTDWYCPPTGIIGPGRTGSPRFGSV